MAACDECGSGRLVPLRIEGVDVEECALCGALSGRDDAVSRVLLAREAREKGIDPGIYPLVLTLSRIDGLQVVGADFGEPERLVWPFVQLAPVGAGALRGVESLVKSLALTARGQEVHWVVEVEFQSRLLLTLKPRFHRDVAKITPQLVAAAQRSLERIRANLEVHMALSWW
jgi:hypothetical protein